MSKTFAPIDFLSPGLMARLERMEIVSRKVFRGRMKGERRSSRQGQSVEFADFRGYVPGDDLRMIDWNLYARLDQLFLKLFREEEDLHLHVLVDASESMRFGNPSKLFVASQLAAALGYVGLCRSDRVRVAALGKLGDAAPVLRGRTGFHRLVDYLTLVNDPGATQKTTSLSEAVKDFLIRGGSTGIVVLVTDLMDKSGYESALRMLVGRRMDILLVHLLSPEELDPPIRGDLRLIDAEDGDVTEMTISPYTLKRYQQTVNVFIEQARQFCARRNIAYVFAKSDASIDLLITQYLQKRGVVR